MTGDPVPEHEVAGPPGCSDPLSAAGSAPAVIRLSPGSGTVFAEMSSWTALTWDGGMKTVF